MFDVGDSARVHCSNERDAMDAVHGGLTGCYRNDPGLDVLRGSTRNMQTGRSVHTGLHVAALLCSDQPSTFRQRSPIIVICSNQSLGLQVEFTLAT